MAAAIPLLLDPRPHDRPHDRMGRPLRDLRLSVLATCNFRCPYCMPAERYPRDDAGDAASRLSFDEIETLVRAFATVGMRTLRLTGGEPLLRRGLPDLVARLARIEGIEDLALTTNGSLLPRHAAALRAAGLSRLTVSLDTLDPARFSRLSGGRGDVAQVLNGIAAAQAAGFASLRINCVVQRGVNDGDVLALVEHFRGSGHVLRFIEYMDVGTCNGWDATRVVPTRELHAQVHARWPLRALAPARHGEVAQRHAFVDGGGEIGFVSSISAPFCGDCHRARVSADGKLYTCLFASTGTDLRPALRQGEAVLAGVVSDVWQRRADRYSQLRAETAGRREAVEMYAIGG